MTEKVKEKKEEQKPKLSVYATLQKIDVKPYIKKKMGLDYLSWATAWSLVKSHYPDAKKEFTEYPEYIPSKGEWISTGRQVPYRLTPFGCEVEATVTINGEKTSQSLYVMDNRGNSVKAQALDMKLINKAQQRCLVKALATAGLGLEIYAGEDLPEEPQQKQTAPKPAQKPVRRQATPSKPKKMTKDQLYGYQADYNGEKKFLVAIYTECDKQKKMGLDAKKSVPIEWWHEKLKENSADGEAVRQFTEMAIDANKKKQAKAKIEQSNGIPDYAKDPEVEAEIEKALS